MNHMSLRKTLSTATLVGGMIMAVNVMAQTPGGNGQDHGMMHGNSINWMGGYGVGMGGYGVGMGGYGGWQSILLVIVVAGLVIWIFKQEKK